MDAGPRSASCGQCRRYGRPATGTVRPQLIRTRRESNHVSDPAEFLTAYVASPDLATDMQGFDVSDILDVEDVLLDPVAGSPLA